MGSILLTRGVEAHIDDCDFDWFNQWTWYAQRGRNGLYAARREGRLIYLHIELGQMMGLIGSVDHRDLNTLNDCRDNLRLATAAQNMANRGLYQNNQTGFKGVCWEQKNQKWKAEISFEKRRKFLGYFDSAIEAAEAYDRAARRLHGEYGRYNFPREGEQGAS